MWVREPGSALPRGLATRFLGLLALFALCFGAPSILAQSGSTEEADHQALVERGRLIYEQGLGSSEITAVMAGNLEVPGSVLVCAGCHGERGEGRPEGGVSPSDLRPVMLRRPYEVRSASGRTHGPYDDRSLVRAIAMGTDPAGNALQASMPRYRMGREDMNALVAYLGQVGEQSEAGVGEEEIRIGVVGPSHEEVGKGVDTYFSEGAESGGIFGRRLKKIEVSLSSNDVAAGDENDSEAQSEARRQRLQELDVFALVGGSLGLDRSWIEAAESLGIPWIGPSALDLGSMDPSVPRAQPPGAKASTFYLVPGLRGQAVALADHLAQQETQTGPGRAPRLVTLRSAPEPLASVAEAWARRWAELGQPEPERIVVAPGEALPASSDAGPMVLLVPGRLGQRLLAAAGPSPIYAPGALAASWGPLAGRSPSAGLSPAGEARLFVAVEGAIGAGQPGSPGTKLRSAPRAVRHTLAGLHLLSEALYRAGADPTRERLVASLESLFEFHTGFTPPISYGPNRRVGMDALRVEELDLR